MKKIKLNFNFFNRLPAHEKRITLSTVFTASRMVVTPFVVFSMIKGYWGVACILFLYAALTDMVDGTLARLRNEQTFLGACLDPLADKFLLLSIFATLALVDTPLFAIPQWFLLLVLVKEFLLVGGAVALYFIKGHIEVRPTMLGKVTTVVQICFVAWLFACYFFEWMPVKTYYTMLGILMGMIGATFLQYARIGLRFLKINV